MGNRVSWNKRVPNPEIGYEGGIMTPLPSYNSCSSYQKTLLSSPGFRRSGAFGSQQA